jgi:orotate phosphoribosyltransferase
LALYPAAKWGARHEERGRTLSDERRRLRELLRQNSLIFGDFTLASGRKSRYYFDSKKTTLLPEGAYLTARQILRVLRDLDVQAEAIGGMTLGADPIVGAVTALSFVEGPPLRGFIVRREAKEHGTAKRVEGNVQAGSRVVVVDDVVTTGGSTLSAIEAAEEAGLEVVQVVCLVDREEGGSRALSRWPFRPVFVRSEIFDEAPEREPT